MTNVSNDRLADLDLFPTGMVPKGRREALESVLQRRRETVGRAVSCGAMLALCAIFAIFYGAVSAFAWTMGAHPVFGILFSVFSAGLLIAGGHLAQTLHGHLREVVPVPDRLRREAEAEAELERAALDANVKAIFWNALARSANAHGVDDAIFRGLRAQRTALERRRIEVSDNLARFLAATASKPRGDRPPGAREPDDIGATDS